MSDRNPGSASSAKRKRVTKSVPSRTTRIIVSAKSSNECAFPDCPEKIIEKTASGEEYLAGELCHIYGRAAGSARYDATRSEEENAAPKNLLFLCRNHHRVVDADPDGYSVSALREMKAAHEQQTGSVSRARLIDLLTRTVQEALRRLRQARFFQGFDSTNNAFVLKKKIQEEYAAAEAAARARALAWCARVLAEDRSGDAAECVRDAQVLAPDSSAVPEVGIARAVLESQSDVEGALALLGAVGSPSARGAALEIVNNRRGNEEALSWIEQAGHSAGDLDSDGRLFFLLILLTAGQWNEVERLVESFDAADFKETPALHYLVAVSLLTRVVPDDLRPVIISGTPFNASTFPLASTADAVETRRRAVMHFDHAGEAGRKLGVSDGLQPASDYSLWLRLRDPESHDAAMNELREACASLSDNLRLIPMAIQYEAPLDLDAVDKLTAERLNSKDTAASAEAATARFALGSTKPPLDGARFLEANEDLLSGPLDRDLVRATRVELLIVGKDYKRAKQVLRSLGESETAADEKRRLEAVLRSAETKDAEALKARYSETRATRDLDAVVRNLEIREDWEGVALEGRRLFGTTQSLADGERLARALINIRGDEELESFLSDNERLVDASDTLRAIRCWHLFNRGKVLECRERLEESANDSEPNLHNLRINLAVVTGDWDGIPLLVGSAYANRNEKDVRELVELAEQSLHFDLPYTKDLVRSIAERGSMDAEALAAAYWLAMASNMEEEPEVGDWLRQAIALSDADGPFRAIPTAQVFERGKEWHRTATEVSEGLRQGKLPIFTAAQVLNMPLLEMTLRVALRNLRSDGIRSGVVPAYSGVRGKAVLRDTSRVGLCPTAVLTLSVLGLLEDLISDVGSVMIPHGTLPWLLAERERIRFHQPSRLVEARRVIELVSEGVLESVPEAKSDDDAGDDAVAPDLAALLASQARDGTDTREVVVAPYPVRTWVDGEMKAVDLSRRYGHFVSPGSVIRALASSGVLAESEAREVVAHLSDGSRPWPREPTLQRGDRLLLASLTLGEFVQPRLLSRGLPRLLHRSGFRLAVSEVKLRTYRDVVVEEEVAEDIRKHVEAIRKTLAAAIEDRTVTLGPLEPKAGADEETNQHPVVDLMRVAGRCSGVMTDDRFMNQLPAFDSNGRSVPVWTTWDWLRSRGKSYEDTREFARKLRQAGYLLPPITAEELQQEVGRAGLGSRQVTETAEMRAIRREVEAVRAQRCLRVPGELPWLTGLVAACAEGIWKTWLQVPDAREAALRVGWINGLLRSGEWGVVALAGRDTERVAAGYVRALRAPPGGLARDDRYLSWVEQEVVTPLRDRLSSGD